MIVVSLLCGQTSSENCTYLTLGSTTTATLQTNCVYTLCEMNPNICRMRLDFMVSTFSLTGSVIKLVERSRIYFVFRLWAVLLFRFDFFSFEMWICNVFSIIVHIINIQLKSSSTASSFNGSEAICSSRRPCVTYKLFNLTSF